MLWPPWYSTDQQHRVVRSRRSTTRSNQAIINPSTGVITGGPRYNGIVLPGDGFPREASDLAVYNDPAVNALFVGAPRGLTKTHKNVFEPRGGVSYAWNDKTVVKASAGVFHNRVTLNDSLLLGGNPPFQPQVSVSNGSVDNPGRRRRRGGAAARHDGDRSGVQAPGGLHLFGGRAAPAALGFVRRRDLRRPPGPQPPARAQHQPARRRHGAGATRASTRRRCVPTRATASSGCRRHEAARSTTACSSASIAATATGSSSAPPTRSASRWTTRSSRRDVLFNTFDDSGYWGPSSFDRRHVFNFYYIYDLPFFSDQTSMLARDARRLADLRLHVHAHRHAAVGDARRPTSPASATPSRSRTNQVGDPSTDANGKFSAGAGADQNFWFNPGGVRAPATGTFGNAPRNGIYDPGQYQWDIALFKNVRARGTATRLQFRAEIFNFLNHANLERRRHRTRPARRSAGSRARTTRAATSS